MATRRRRHVRSVLDAPESKPAKRQLNRRVLDASASTLVNTVTAVGVFARDWPVGTGLALYWGETIVTAFALLALIAIWSYGRGEPLIRSTIVATLGLSAAHLIFLIAVVGFVLPRYSPSERFDWRSFAEGMVLIAALVFFQFAVRSVHGRDRSDLALDELAAPYLKRVLVLHFTIILGMGALAALGKPRALFGGFAVIKALVDTIGSAKS